MKWDQQYPSEKVLIQNISEWAEGISGLTDEQLAKGVNAVRESCEWPPSIAEFRRLCTGGSDDSWRWAAYNQQKRKALPNKRCDKSIADAEREKLKKLGVLKGDADI